MRTQLLCGASVSWVTPAPRLTSHAASNPCLLLFSPYCPTSVPLPYHTMASAGATGSVPCGPVQPRDALADFCDAIKLGVITEVQSSIRGGQDVNLTHDGNYPLHVTALSGHLDVCAALVKAGAHVNAVNGGGMTPLHVAAKFGHPEVCDALLAAGANVNAVDVHGATPLHFAATGALGGHEACAVLLAGGRKPMWPQQLGSRRCMWPFGIFVLTFVLPFLKQGPTCTLLLAMGFLSCRGCLVCGGCLERASHAFHYGASSLRMARP